MDLKEILLRTPDRRKIGVMCEFLGVTRAQLGKASGVSPTVLRFLKYRSRTPGPTARTLVGLANALGLELEDVWDCPRAEGTQ